MTPTRRMGADFEREYIRRMLAALSPHLPTLPKDAQRAVLLAQSVIESHGSATGAELRLELGDNWVLARRTRGIVERYGADVKCYSPKQYEMAQRRAIEKRVAGG